MQQHRRQKQDGTMGFAACKLYKYQFVKRFKGRRRKAQKGQEYLVNRVRVLLLFLRICPFTLVIFVTVTHLPTNFREGNTSNLDFLFKLISKSLRRVWRNRKMSDFSPFKRVHYNTSFATSRRQITGPKTAALMTATKYCWSTVSNAFD